MTVIRLPFGRKDKDELTDPQEILDKEIRETDETIRALSFCLSDLLLDSEISHSDIVSGLDERHTDLLVDAQNYMRTILNKGLRNGLFDGDEHLSESDKDMLVKYRWPEFLTNALLMRFGFPKDQQHSLDDIPEALGKRTREFSDNLLLICKDLYLTVLPYTGYDEAALIMPDETMARCFKELEDDGGPESAPE